MSEKRISVARDFSRDPGLRYVSQGPNSGERFRRMLIKALREHDRVTVDLDGTRGIGSSFLDEAFGGLIFAEGMSAKEVRTRVLVTSKLDETYIAMIEESLDAATPKKIAAASRHVQHA